MANRKPVDDKTKWIVRPKPSRTARAANAKPIKTSKRTGRRRAYRAKIEALLAELTCERLLLAWKQVCPSPIANAFGLPDRPGIIQDLADFAEVLQPDLRGTTADQLCRQVEKYGGAANRKTNRPTLRLKALRV